MSDTRTPEEYAIDCLTRAELAVQALAQEYAAARAEIERLKAELQDCRDLLRRFTPHCEDMNHLPEGMHDPMEPCPLERRFKEASRD